MMVAWRVPGLTLAVILLLIGLAPALARSQAVSPPSPAANPLLVAHNPQVDETEDIEDALKIGRLDVTVDVAGSVATTTVTVRLDNTTRAALEGDFTLDLPPGAVITGYALDVNGAMVDGVLVGQRQAEQAYQKRLRQGVDPGIAKITRTNAFNTRVFPVMGHGSRTLRLTFAAPLDAEGDFVLPLNTGAVDAARIAVTSDDRRGLSVLSSPAGLTLKAGTPEGRTLAQGEAANAPLTGALRIGRDRAAPVVRVTRHASGELFFDIEDAAPAARSPGFHPERVRLYWDRSRSRRDDDLAGELALVERYLALAAPKTIDIVLFADGAPQVRTVSSPAEAMAVLKGVKYRGATSLESLLAQRLPGADACLMFTDGNITLDPYRVRRVGCPLFTVSSAPDAGQAFLSALARASGGEQVDLRAGADLALSRITRAGTRVVDIVGAAGEDIDYALLPAAPGRFHVVGRLPDTTQLRVSLAGVAGPPRVYEAEPPPARRAPARGAGEDAAGALWAADRLGGLGATDRPDADRILAFARRYGVASPIAAFIVLETPQDYAQAGIEPPASLGKEVREAYDQLVADRKRGEAQSKAGRLEQVLAAWTEQKAWWNTVFNPPRRVKRKAPDNAALARPSQRVAEAAPAAAPSPMRPPAREEAMDTAVGEVVVTGQRSGGQAFNAPAAVSTIGQDQLAITVEAAPWDPDRPYLKALDAAAPDAVWDVYDAEEAKSGDLPAFYFDVAEWLFRKGRAADAVSVALNVLDLPTADTATLTILADRLMRYGEERRALWLYERILYLEPDRPQPRRNLALALITRADRVGRAGGSPQARLPDYERAIGLLNEVIMRPWSGSYDGIEMVSLMEANRIVPILRELDSSHIPLDPRLIAPMEVDIRVTLEWNTDHTDMDLWVDEPNGERAIYSNPRTGAGGRLSNDMTDGYGPEEYLLRRAPGGTFTVRANVYAADRLDPNGATVVRARLFRDWGRPTQKEEVLEIELKAGDDGEMVVGSFTVGKKKP